MKEKQKAFLVKDSRVVNTVVAIVFLAMFLSALWYDVFDNSPVKANVKIAYLSIIPAIVFMMKAFKNKIVLAVNADGIFHEGRLVTNWSNFVSADYSQEEKILSMQDNFILIVTYLNPEEGMQYSKKIGLANTLDKSEEQIIEAIKKYCNG
jgi:hypothetical protein